MNTLKLLIAAIFAVFFITAQAQSPQLMNYQAVVRNASGQPVTSGNINIRFTIHDGTANGTTVFSEHQLVTPNQFGLVTAAIGAGGGNLAIVNWSTGNKYLEVETDVTGGTNYISMGNTQLISVPYALFAANSAAGPQGPTGPIGAQGATGLQGNTGATGADGSNGATGTQGPTGAQGIAGATGADGVDGVTGAQGPTGPVGAQGAAGLAGNTGATGADGTNGATGIQGSTGPAGAQGAMGLPGITGTAGINGIDGVTGAQGSTGVQGNTGAIGNTGATGPVGCSTPNTVLKSDGAAAVCSQIYDDGVHVGVATTGPTATFDVNGSLRVRTGSPVYQSSLTATDNLGNATWTTPPSANTVNDGGLQVGSGTATALFTPSVTLPQGVYHVTPYNCLTAASTDYYVRFTATAISGTISTGGTNRDFSQLTSFSMPPFILKVTSPTAVVQFEVLQGNGGTITNPNNQCTAFQYTLIGY